MIARVRKWYWNRASDKARHGLDEGLRELDGMRQEIMRLPFIYEELKARLEQKKGE